jgi:hypothetical protein
MLRKTYILAFALIWAGMAALQGGAGAEKPGDLDKHAKKLNDQAARLGDHDRTFEVFSRELGVPAETLKAQQESTKLGFGELFIANALANSTGKSFDTLSQEFKSGRGWGAIANENNVKLGSIIGQMKRSNQALEQARNDRARAGQQVQASKNAAAKDRQQGSTNAGKGRGPGQPPTKGGGRP